MTTNETKVCPLAVMGRAEVVFRLMPGTRAELREARAAVAELVAADRQMDFTPLDHLPDDHPCTITVRAGDLRRRNAALAKFGGAP